MKCFTNPVKNLCYTTGMHQLCTAHWKSVAFFMHGTAPVTSSMLANFALTCHRVFMASLTACAAVVLFTASICWHERINYLTGNVWCFQKPQQPSSHLRQMLHPRISKFFPYVDLLGGSFRVYFRRTALTAQLFWKVVCLWTKASKRRRKNVKFGRPWRRTCSIRLVS